MAHFIEFRGNFRLTVEKGGTTVTCKFRIGRQCPAQVHCYVVCANDRYVEVADIELKDGVMRGIPCSCFMFIDVLD
jgi:hypothetical protein